jgi:hypothetical protein
MIGGVKGATDDEKYTIYMGLLELVVFLIKFENWKV